MKGSIFRGRGSVRSQKDNSAPGSGPSIQVTEDGSTPHANGHHHHLPHLTHRHKHDESHAKVGRSSSKLRNRSTSLGQQSVTGNSQATDAPPLPEGASNGISAKTDDSRPLSSTSRKSVDTSETPLRPVAHNLTHDSPPQGHEQQPPRQDTRLPAPLPDANYIPPDPRFSKLQDRRQKVSLLLDIWIFISRLYTRAQAFEDAKDAADEALKLVETFETELALEFSTAKALADKGWGGGKSVEELWADAYTAVSRFAIKVYDV